MVFTMGSLLALAPVLLGFLLFGVGGVSCMFNLARMSARSMSEVRRKLSELNARFAPQGVDFQLHESRHLVPYASFSEATGHFSTGVRRITEYTLVIQRTPVGVVAAIL